MDSVPKSRLIRQYIRSTLLALGEPQPPTVVESLLIRDGIYCGHRFRRNAYEAVWFVEENQVKFYGPDGALLQTADANDVAVKQTQQAA